MKMTILKDPKPVHVMEMGNVFPVSRGCAWNQGQSVEGVWYSVHCGQYKYKIINIDFGIFYAIPKYIFTNKIIKITSHKMLFRPSDVYEGNLFDQGDMFTNMPLILL